MVTLGHELALNLTTQSDDDLSMILSKQNIAVGLIGLASLTWMGVSSALEAGDPVLDDEVVVVDDCSDDTTADETVTDGTEGDDALTDDEALTGEEEAVEDDCTDGEADGDETTDGTEVTDDEVTDDGEEPVVDEDAEEGTEAEVAEHPENHGKYVSEAARETCPAGPGHGQCVREVAQSDAGKPGAEDDGDAVDGTEGDDVVVEAPVDDTETDTETELEADDDVEGATAPAAGGPGNGRGSGRGNGNGKG